MTGATASALPLAGKVAVVTGASRGIGAAIARRMGLLGADVVVNYGRDADGAARTVAAIVELGSRAFAVQADVSRPDDLAALFTTTTDRMGGVDVVVANAGVDEVGSDFLDVSEDEFDRLFAVNAKGAFFTLQHAARSVRRGGSIVVVGSSTTLRPVAGFGLYGSSKTPGTYLAGVLAQELVERGVTVNTVLPTATEGAGYFADAPAGDPVRAGARGTATIGGRMGTVEDVADAVEYLVGPLARWTSGQAVLVAGGAPS